MDNTPTLTDEEIVEAIHGFSIKGYCGDAVTEQDRKIAQAGIEKGRQQVIEWGNEICRIHYNRRRYTNPLYTKRYECPSCWAELQKEANSE